jgi:hypothetical protein
MMTSARAVKECPKAAIAPENANDFNGHFSAGAMD